MELTTLLGVFYTCFILSHSSLPIADCGVVSVTGEEGVKSSAPECKMDEVSEPGREPKCLICLPGLLPLSAFPGVLLEAF